MNIKRALTWLSAIGGTIDNVIIGTIAVTTGITVPDAVNGTDAVNLHTLQDHVGFDVDYYFHATSAMSTTVTESETYDAETLNATPVDTMTLFYKSTVLDTPAPFTLNAGSNINFHFNAKVSTVTGVKLVTVQMRLFYVDADGTSNKTAIAPISDPTASLTATKTYCELHSHVATEITVPTGKRLWIELYANTSGASGNYPDLWIYRDSGINHLSFGVAGGILGNFVQKTELATPPAIGKTTPAEGWFSPNVSKGPAALTTFAGTVSTSGSSTTITFTSAADAILAGYNATNPILGTTLITTAVNQASVTRYITSWTNSTACVVDTACTLAASSTLASVQLPIATFVNSAGETQGWMDAAGVVRIFGLTLTGSSSGTGLVNGGIIFGYENNANYTGYLNWTGYLNSTAQFRDLIIGNGKTVSLFKSEGSTGNILTGGITAAGTSAAKVHGIGAGTAPTTSPADIAQMWVEDKSGVAGAAGLHMRDELDNSGPIAFAQLKIVTHSATENASAANMYGHFRVVTGAYTVSIPTATVGYHTSFMASTAAVFSVDVITGTDIMRLNGTALTAGNKVTSDGSLCAQIYIKCVVAGIYEVTTVMGIFVDGGA